MLIFNIRHMLHYVMYNVGSTVGVCSVRTRAIMAFEHCSGSVNPVVSELVKNVVTPRFTDRRSAPPMLVKTPSQLHGVPSHRQSGPILALCCSCFCQIIRMILTVYYMFKVTFCHELCISACTLRNLGMVFLLSNLRCLNILVTVDINHCMLLVSLLSGFIAMLVC